MLKTLNDYEMSESIGEPPLCNVRFSDDSDRVAGQELELQHVSTRLEKLSKCINTEKQFFKAYIWE